MEATTKEARIAELERRLRAAEERVAAGERESARLVEEARRNGERMRVLYEASHAFAEAVDDPDRLIATVARACCELVGDFSSITLIRHSKDGDWLELGAVYHPDPELQEAFRALSRATRLRIGDGVMGKVLRDDTPLLLAEVDPEAIVARAPDAYKDAARRLHVCSFVGVPMHARGRVIGGISMARSRPGVPYADADVAYLQDLADRAALAIENALLHAGLEQRVADGLARLEAANRELESFSYSVAHDLRAPLRSIDGFSQAVLEDSDDRLDAESRGHLHRVRGAAQRMGKLIDDLLDLARVSRAEIHREPVDLSALARSVLARLQGTHPGRHVEVVVEPGLVVHADPHLLEVVLTNLLGNAWKFTGKRAAARIELAVRAGEAPTVYLVRDNGAGFDPTYAGKLFGVFQRLHQAHEFEGTGIGLATVQRIIRRHGGRVWAEGEVDRGATFYFTLGL